MTQIVNFYLTIFLLRKVCRIFQCVIIHLITAEIS